MAETDRIFELTEKYFTSQNKNEIDTELKELLLPYGKGSIGIAQINPKVGDIEYNSKKIVQYINFAQSIGLDLVVFPELIMSGFPLENSIENHPIIANECVKWLNEIAKITTKTTALVGFVEPYEDKFYDSVAVLNGGKITDIIRRKSLPNNSEFNDFNCITPFESLNNMITVNGIKYGILIGEDYCNTEQNADVIINICAVPTKIKNEQIKHSFMSSLAQKYSTPLVYVNQVGATDGVSFDGTSRVFNKNGEMLACAKSFEEHFLIVNPVKNLGKIYPSVMLSCKDNQSQFSLDYEPDMERTYKTLIQGIKDYFGKTGFRRAVLGLSGGLDSTVCAVLLTDALGKENVFGVSMPSKITSQTSKDDAQILAQNLGIGFTVSPIKDMFDTTNNCLQNLFADVEKHWDNRYKQSFTADNIQARSRAMFLWGVSNEFGSCLPIATSDKSEAYMGYATINGDMSGGFAPIADITKTKLFALARWLNKNREQKNAIPQSVIDKRPGAELAIDPKTNKPLIAEDALMPYEFLDEVIWRIENKKENYNIMLNSEFLYEKSHPVTREQKTMWLDKFYRRMSTALYKKSIMPPYVIVDSPSYNSKQPITSCGINYKGFEQKEIEQKIQQWL
ncbi:NAD(+) synthase [bacterium]|nr:NAD(+) synthase [bacterium]